MIIFDAAEVRVPGDDRVIVHPLSVSLEERRIALIGANGSGKSTIARMINGLVLPASGSVLHRTAEGDLSTARDGRLVRQRVGFMFTDPRAQLVMPTVAEDLALSLKRLHRNKADRVLAVSRILDEYGLSGRGDQSVHTLSGGQQQLLALASVLAAEPQVLVADEPTTLLDLRNSRIIGDRLMGLEQQLVLATHDLDLAARCDRVLVIEDGRVVFDGVAGAAIDFYRASVERDQEQHPDDVNGDRP